MTPSADLLAAMMASARRAALERARTSSAEIARQAASRSPRAAAFHATLSAAGVRIIAECKRRSPSRGVLRTDYAPAAIAAGYESAGAAAISVLTEATFFDGSLDHLSDVRASVSVPVLRKDFISTTEQVVEARAAGADAILLIVAALSDQELRRLLKETDGMGLAALVEAHTREEVTRAVDAGADIVGVNSRNLRTLDVDLDTFEAVLPGRPSGGVLVAESGLRTGGDIARLRSLGYDAFLVGERFMTAPDPAEALRGLLADATNTSEVGE